MIDKLKALSLEQKKRIASIVLGLTVLLLGWKVLIEKDLQTLNKFRQIAAENAPKQALLDETAVLEKKIKNYAEFFSPKKQSDWFIDLVSTAAAESGLTLLSAVPQTPVEGEAAYGKMTLTLEAGGTYHKVGHFIETIENHKPLIKVNFMRIYRTNAEVKDPLKLSVTLNAYYPSDKALCP